MAIFIAIVKRDSEAAYTASFPDFPGLSSHANSLDELLTRSREVLARHVEHMLEANATMNVPTPAHEIERHDALLLAAIDIPENLKTAHIELEIPAFALA